MADSTRTFVVTLRRTQEFEVEIRPVVTRVVQARTTQTFTVTVG